MLLIGADKCASEIRPSGCRMSLWEKSYLGWFLFSFSFEIMHLLSFRTLPALAEEC